MSCLGQQSTNSASSVICAATLLSLLLSTGAIAIESATPTLPTDTQRPALPSANTNWSVSTTFDARFSTWTGSRGSNTFAPEPGKGTQFYFPQTLTVFYQQPDAYRIETNVKGAYVISRHQALNQDVSLSTFVDTQVSSTITFLNNESYRFFLGVALNLPTGKSFLPGTLRFARMDPDLVDIGTYGVGFNANPTAGFIFGLNENTAMSLSAGYAWLGQYTKESVFPGILNSGPVEVENVPTGRAPPVDVATPARIDPGDVFTANINTASIFDRWSFKTSFAYMSETNVKVDGLPLGRAGATLTSNIAATILLDPRWAVLLNGSWKFSQKNKILDPFGALVTEPKNSNSNLFIGSVDLSYAVSERIRVAPNYSILYRDKNSYDFIEDQFIPEKLKQSVGLSATYTASPTSSITLRGSHFWVVQQDGPFLITSTGSFVDTMTGSTRERTERQFQPPSLHFQGWAGAITGRISF